VGFGQDVERVYHFLRVECVNFLQGSRFERLQCSIYDPAGCAIALALEKYRLLGAILAARNTLAGKHTAQRCLNGW
jgi:hypothetical protein